MHYKNIKIYIKTAPTCFGSITIIRERIPSQSQAKVLTEGGDLREAQIDVSLSVSHSCVRSQSWAQ
jgi:hypothetical protein